MINKPLSALFISVLSASFAAIFIVSCDAPSLSIALYRLLFTTLLILPFVILNKKVRKELLEIPRSTFIVMIGIGIVLAAHFAFWITSLEFTSVASSVMLVTAHPVLVAPVAHYFFKERLSPVNIVGIVLSVSGVVLLVYGNYGLSSLTLDTLEGNILAILGGIAAGIYILGGRGIRRNVSIVPYAIVVYGVGTLALLIICLLFNAPVYGLNVNDYFHFTGLVTHEAVQESSRCSNRSRKRHRQSAEPGASVSRHPCCPGGYECRRLVGSESGSPSG